MMHKAIIAVLCMTLSGQALAWTAMPCCAEPSDDAPPARSMNDGLNHGINHEMDQGHAGCAEDGNDQDADRSASQCCPGAFCSGVFAVVSSDMALEAPALSADVFAGHGMLANAPPEQLLRPPIT